MRILLSISLVFLMMLCVCPYVFGQSGQGYVTVYLVDGDILIGKIVASDETTIKIEPILGGQITVYRSYIKEIKQGCIVSYNFDGLSPKDSFGEMPIFSSGEVKESKQEADTRIFSPLSLCLGAYQGAIVGGWIGFNKSHWSKKGTIIGATLGATIGGFIGFRIHSKNGKILLGIGAGCATVITAIGILGMLAFGALFADNW